MLLTAISRYSTAALALIFSVLPMYVDARDSMGENDKDASKEPSGMPGRNSYSHPDIVIPKSVLRARKILQDLEVTHSPDIAVTFSRPELSERPEKPVRPDRPERPERPIRVVRPELPARPGRPERPDKPGKP